jgi:hypothetical protein
MRTDRHNDTSRPDEGKPAYDLAEYTLLLSLIALAVIAVLTITGNPLPGLIQAVRGTP